MIFTLGNFHLFYCMNGVVGKIEGDGADSRGRVTVCLVDDAAHFAAAGRHSRGPPRTRRMKICAQQHHQGGKLRSLHPFPP